jgi:hypothetical protein
MAMTLVRNGDGENVPMFDDVALFLINLMEAEEDIYNIFDYLDNYSVEYIGSLAAQWFETDRTIIDRALNAVIEDINRERETGHP